MHPCNVDQEQREANVGGWSTLLRPCTEGNINIGVGKLEKASPTGGQRWAWNIGSVIFTDEECFSSVSDKGRECWRLFNTRYHRTSVKRQKVDLFNFHARMDVVGKFG